ncbi:VENN motif pre-toxin domain-containing protein [Neisseria sp.]
MGTVMGAAVGNSATDGVQGSLNANSAVENNYISFPNKNDAINSLLWLIRWWVKPLTSNTS